MGGYHCSQLVDTMYPRAWKIQHELAGLATVIEQISITVAVIDIHDVELTSCPPAKG